MHANGVAGTTIDQVIEASGTSKSQLYHYFADKDALVAAVIKMQSARVLERQEPHLSGASWSPPGRRPDGNRVVAVTATLPRTADAPCKVVIMGVQ